ncbi:DUF2971 domain-containing protein [Sunxiuqinia elliptica]|uniref:DUF2971 family protein n=1 Tax=Sunxiuqinia elliptica TaxID=655355 RepID=A0A4R6GVW4_9BACT|nr:DUF2971 domain-containing protein [Sunxiuqinia elliptica]TDN98884.1 DUF2971 family protein [Sunxiuqinia elliptica]TDO56325.1 DUF2971 family protein [Sunxiuqinia elliptica]
MNEEELYRIDLATALNSEISPLDYISKFLRRGNLVYHYTDFNGVIGIIQNQSLFSSNATYLNDYSELEYGNQLISETILKVIKNKDLKGYINLGEKEISLLEKTLTFLKNWSNSNIYVCCFSYNSDLLSQWRGYANNGNGVAIGFSIDELRDSITPKVHNAIVEYNRQKQIKELEEIIAYALDFAIVNHSDYGHTKKEAFKYFPKALVSTLTSLTPRFKNIGFKEEDEYRLIYDPIYHEKYKDKTEHTPTQLFRTNGKHLIPYVELKPKKDKFPIRELVIGPSMHKDRIKNGLRELLENNGYTDVKITYSKIPFVS